jgi:hypothetical protein
MICEGERVDDLQLCGLRIIQKDSGFRFGMDAVLLSDFARVEARDLVADFGTGTGILPLLLAGRGRGAHFDALKEEFAQYGIKLDASCRDTSRLRFLSYDPEAYINENAEVYTRVIETKVYPYEMERPALPATCILPDEIKVRRCVDKIIQYGIDITGGYEDWLRIGMSLDELGEQGRSYFHAASSQYADYKRHEADEKFTQCLRRSRSTNSGRGPIGLATFFHICMDYGITYRKEQYE